jgi:hypothetical protein
MSLRLDGQNNEYVAVQSAAGITNVESLKGFIQTIVATHNKKRYPLQVVEHTTPVQLKLTSGSRSFTTQNKNVADLVLANSTALTGFLSCLWTGKVYQKYQGVSTFYYVTYIDKNVPVTTVPNSMYDFTPSFVFGAATYNVTPSSAASSSSVSSSAPKVEPPKVEPPKQAPLKIVEKMDQTPGVTGVVPTDPTEIAIANFLECVQRVFQEKMSQQKNLNYGNLGPIQFTQAQVAGS